MRKSVSIVLILLAGITGLFAAKLQWTSNPSTENVTHYTVYEHVGATYTALATVTPTASPTQVWPIPSPSPGPHNYAVSATNVAGEGPKTADVLLPAAPTAPTGLTLLP